MSRKQQTIDDLAKVLDEAVAGAVEFTATIRALDPKGSGLTKSFTVRRPSLELARFAAKQLEDGFNNGRKSLVYAVTGTGAAVLVPADYALEGAQ